MTKPYSGARYEIAIDGTVRTHRDRKDLATETASFLKTSNVYAQVVVLDLETDETIVVKHLVSK
jgi:hypothetical protein